MTKHKSVGRRIFQTSMVISAIAIAANAKAFMGYSILFGSPVGSQDALITSVTIVAIVSWFLMTIALSLNMYGFVYMWRKFRTRGVIACTLLFPFNFSFFAGVVGASRAYFDYYYERKYN